MRREKASIAWERGTVSAVWHHPEPAGGTYLVLGHGAGGNMHTPQLAAFADGMAGRGVGALRFNFPYAEARRKSPDPQPALEACYRAVAEHAATRARRLLIGGRSLGGRMASHVAADGFPAAGLVFLAYPLHPPGKHDRLRDAHLGRVGAPMLFFQGTRDSFARFDLLTRTLEGIPRATLHVIENADHSFKVPGRSPDDVVEELVSSALDWIAKLG